MENGNTNERLTAELVDWSAFTEQDFERMKECAFNHTDCDDTPVQLLSDRYSDLQIEFRVKQLGSEWVLDVDAYNKTDEIMTAITGYTEDAVKELKYNDMKADVESGLKEELGLDEDYSLEGSLFAGETFHAIDPYYEGSPNNIYIEFLMEEVSLSLYEKLAEKTGLLAEMNCKTLEELEDNNNLVFLYVNVYENGKVGVVLTYGNDYEHNIDLTEAEQKYLRESIENEWLAKGEPLDKIMNEARANIADEYSLIIAVGRYYFEAEDPYISNENGSAVVDFAVSASDEICREMVDRTNVLAENGYSSYDKMLNNYDRLNIYVSVHEDNSVTAVTGISGTDYYEDVPLTMKEQTFIRETISDIYKDRVKTLDDLMSEAVKEIRGEHSKPAPKKNRSSIEL